MNFVKVAKMALAAGFVAVSLMGQPLTTQAAEVPVEEVTFNYTEITYSESRDTDGGREQDRADDLVVETVESAAIYIEFEGVAGDVTASSPAQSRDRAQTAEMAVETVESAASYIEFEGLAGEVTD